MPRMLKEGVSLKIRKNSYPTLPIFNLIQKVGNIPERDMYNTFNMGIGMAIIVNSEDAQKAIDILEKEGENSYIIGEVTKGNGSVEII